MCTKLPPVRRRRLSFSLLWLSGRCSAVTPGPKNGSASDKPACLRTSALSCRLTLNSQGGAMTTAEGILWMQDIMGWKCTTGGSLTTHSLKATLLKWATMSNSMDIQQRRILGHHVDPGSSSPLTYWAEQCGCHTGAGSGHASTHQSRQI